MFTDITRVDTCNRENGCIGLRPRPCDAFVGVLARALQHAGACGGGSMTTSWYADALWLAYEKLTVNTL